MPTCRFLQHPGYRDRVELHCMGALAPGARPQQPRPYSVDGWHESVGVSRTSTSLRRNNLGAAPILPRSPLATDDANAELVVSRSAVHVQRP